MGNRNSRTWRDVAPRNEKMGPTQYKVEVERLQAEDKMPTLEQVLAAITEIRAEYREKILAARKSQKP
jgi:50S ribosomal subunit-associated GTPase HflX